MFQPSHQSYVFGIDSYPVLAGMRNSEVNPVQIRDLWISHLLYQQEQFNKQDANRRPLALALEARNFFGH